MTDWRDVSLTQDVCVNFRLVLVVLKTWLFRKNLQVTISWKQHGITKLANAQLKFEPQEKEVQ